VKVILTADVDKLGKSGEMKDVAEGFARNFLIPKKVAVPAAGGAYRAWQHDIASREEKRQREREVAEIAATRIGSTTLTMGVKVGEGGKLYGSITAKDIADALARRGITVDRHKVELPDRSSRWHVQGGDQGLPGHDARGHDRRRAQGVATEPRGRGRYGRRGSAVPRFRGSAVRRRLRVAPQPRDCTSPGCGFSRRSSTAAGWYRSARSRPLAALVRGDGPNGRRQRRNKSRRLGMGADGVASTATAVLVAHGLSKRFRKEGCARLGRPVRACREHHGAGRSQRSRQDDAHPRLHGLRAAQLG